jgi:hypothetical protein
MSIAFLLSGGKALSLIGSVGFDLVSGAILKSCQSIGSTIYYFHDLPDECRIVSEQLYEQDLEAKITIIHSYIKNLSRDDDRSSESSGHLVCEDSEGELVERIEHLEGITEEKIREMARSCEDSREIAFMFLHQSLLRIDSILHGLKYEIKLHQSKWFRTWRSLKCAGHLKRLKTESEILDRRLKLIQHLSLIRGNPGSP